MSVNKKIFYKLNNLADRSDLFDFLVVFFGHYLPYALGLMVFGFLLIDKGFYGPMVLRAIFASVLARVFVAEIIYRMFPKDRPFVENEVRLLWVPRGKKSFPSGHASFFFAVSFVIWSFYPSIGIFYFACSILMAISRVLGGAHWPIDVLAGAVIGMLCGQVAMMI